MPSATYYNLPDYKKDIIKANAMRVFTDYPYEEISIRQLASEVNISVGAFYKYFRDKDEMYLYYFTATEKKVCTGRLSQSSSFFEDAIPTDDFKLYLTEEEYRFNLTWYKVPIALYYKFYFTGYVKEIMPSYVREMPQLERAGKLKKGLTTETGTYCILSALFSFTIYIREKKIINSLEQVRQHRQFLFEKIIFPAILEEEYYAEHFLRYRPL